MSAFVVSQIKASLNIDSSQRFIFGLEGAPEPLGSLKLDNIYVPLIGSPSVTHFDLRNNALSGFRLRQETALGDTHGTLKIQSFLNGSNTGTDLMIFKEDGTIEFNGTVSATLTLTGAVTGSGTGTINTTLTDITTSQISDFAASVVSFRLDQFSLPTNALDLNNQKITNLSAIEFANTSLDTKIRFFTNNTPDNSFDQSGIGYIDAFGTIYHCPIGKSHRFYGGANGNLAVEINAFRMLVSGSGLYADDFRKVVFQEEADNPHQVYGIGLKLNGLPTNYKELRTQLASSTGSFTWNYGVDSETSRELMRLDQANGLVVKNQVPATVGNDSYTDFKLENSASGGYRFRHRSFSGNPAVGQLSLQVMNGSGDALDIFNIGFSTLSLPGFGGERYTIFGAFETNASQATLGVNEGKNNVLNEASCLRVVSSTNAAKIEIQNTAASGRLYEFRSNSDGSCSIFDRTTGVLRLSIGSTGNLSVNNNRITNLAAPQASTDAATKAFVESAIGSGIVTLGGVVTGTGAVGSTISTSLSSNIPLPYASLALTWNNPSNTGPGTQAPYIFNQVINDNATFFKEHIYQVTSAAPDITRAWQVIYNLGDPNAWNPSYSLKFTHPVFSPSGTTPFRLVNIGGGFSPAWGLFLNATVDMGGYEIKNALNPTTAQSLATRSYVDSFVPSAISNTINVSGATQTFNYSNALSSSIFSLTNTNSSAVTYFRAGTSSDSVQLGYDGFNGYSFINLVSSSNDRLAFRVNGTGVAALISTGGLFGLGTITPTLAKLQVEGGVQNVVGEDTAIRAISALGSVKIELQNTAAGGKVYELRSTSTGIFDIVDRTGSAARLAITTTGDVGINMGFATINAQLQLPNVLRNRQLVLWSAANNNFQFHGFGSTNGGLRYSINGTGDSHIFVAGVNTTTANEVGRITGTGDLIMPGTIYGRRPSAIITMKGNVVGTTVTTANTYYKVAGTTTLSNANLITMPVSNRLQWGTANNVIAYILASFSAFHNGAGGDQIKFSLYKNGSQISTSIITGQGSNNSPNAYTLAALVPITATDYIELWCTHSVNNRIVTVQDLMMMATTT